MRVVKVIMLVDGDNRYDDKILPSQSSSVYELNKHAKRNASLESLNFLGFQT